MNTFSPTVPGYNPLAHGLVQVQNVKRIRPRKASRKHKHRIWDTFVAREQDDAVLARLLLDRGALVDLECAVPVDKTLVKRHERAVVTPSRRRHQRCVRDGKLDRIRVVLVCVERAQERARKDTGGGQTEYQLDVRRRAV